MAWVDCQIKCPYYHRVIVSKRLTGVECDTIPVNLGFDVAHFQRLRDKHELHDYIDIFCADMWETCPYAKLLNGE